MIHRDEEMNLPNEVWIGGDQEENLGRQPDTNGDSVTNRRAHQDQKHC